MTTALVFAVPSLIAAAGAYLNALTARDTATSPERG